MIDTEKLWKREYPSAECRKGDVAIRASFSYIGEGYYGDYDATDEDDVPLLRFDVHLMSFANEEWQEDEWMYLESRCTCIPAESSDDHIREMAEKIAREIVDFMVDHPDGSIRHLCDEFTSLS